MKTITHSVSPDNQEILNYALSHDMIDFDALRLQIEMAEKKKYLNMHHYEIWQGRGGSYYTYLPDENAKYGRRQIKRKDRNALDDAIACHYRQTIEEPYFGTVFYEWIKQKYGYNEIQKQTYDRYEADYKRFIEGTNLSKIKMKSITEDILEDFIKTTIKEQLLLSSRWSNLRIILNGTFKHARKKGYTSISISSFLGDLELSKRAFRKQVVTPEESLFRQKELDAISSYIEQSGPSLIHLGIRLVMYSGLRIGELSALKANDIHKKILSVRRTEIRYKDDNGHYIFEVREYLKGSEGMRDIVLPDTALEILTEIRRMNPHGEYLFMTDGERIKAKFFTNHLEQICRKIGIPPRSMHKVRRTYCTKLLKNGLDDKLIIRQMGHTDISTSKRFYYYDDYEDTEAEKAIQKAVGSL